MLRSGNSETTQIGYVNPNGQECLGTAGEAGNDHVQYAYKVLCQKCGHIYGANGSDLFQRKCPHCQNGKAGIPFESA